MANKYITLKIVKLKNNCPECYSNEDLQLTFKQRFTETRFYKKITHDTTHELVCEKCNTRIYPVQWTEDIELVFKYHLKAIVPKKAAKYLKKKTVFIIGAGIFIMLSLIVGFIYSYFTTPA